MTDNLEFIVPVFVASDWSLPECCTSCEVLCVCVSLQNASAATHRIKGADNYEEAVEL